MRFSCMSMCSPMTASLFFAKVDVVDFHFLTIRVFGGRGLKMLQKELRTSGSTSSYMNTKVKVSQDGKFIVCCGKNKDVYVWVF